MYQLSEQQIDFISSDISARGVEIESLQQNLVDHVCCIIEQNLEANGDFESFYKQTIKTFYKGALWEIEEETLLLLTYKNYYTMKKVMITSGSFSAAAMMLGILFKFMHWPGASMFIILGIGASSLIFLPLLFILKSKDRHETNDKIILGLGILAGILLSLFILFKVMHWPYQIILGYAAVILIGLILLQVFFITGIKNPNNKINTISISILMIMGCGLFLTLVNTRPQARNLDNTEIEYLSNDEIMIQEEDDKLYKSGESDTSMNIFLTRLKNINKSINELKSNLLQHEIGYRKITKNLKHKNINFTIGTFLGYLDRNKEVYKNIEKLRDLINEHSIKVYLAKVKITKVKKTNKQISFESSILNVNEYQYYYDNTILGAYKDLCKIQLNTIEELKDLAELKKQNSQ